MRQTIKLLGVLSVLLGSATTASAATRAYVCQATMLPGAGWWGDHGYVSLRLYTAANCTGTDLGTVSLCSRGATATFCSSSTAHHYSETQLTTTYNVITQHLVNGGKLSYNTGTCNGGAASCLTNLYFQAP